MPPAEPIARGSTSALLLLHFAWTRAHARLTGDSSERYYPAPVWPARKEEIDPLLEHGYIERAKADIPHNPYFSAYRLTNAGWLWLLDSGCFSGPKGQKL